MINAEWEHGGEADEAESHDRSHYCAPCIIRTSRTSLQLWPVLLYTSQTVVYRMNCTLGNCEEERCCHERKNAGVNASVSPLCLRPLPKQ